MADCHPIKERKVKRKPKTMMMMMMMMRARKKVDLLIAIKKTVTDLVRDHA